MTRQRKNKHWGALFYRKVSYNNRGSEIWEADFDRLPMIVPMKHYVLRSARSELPGQQTTDQSFFIVDYKLPDVGAWSVAWWGYSWWDITAPPIRYDSLSRHTRHWTLQARRRPPSIPAPDQLVNVFAPNTKAQLEAITTTQWEEMFDQWRTKTPS